MNIVTFVLEICSQTKSNLDVLEFQAAPTTPQETITSHIFPYANTNYYALRHKIGHKMQVLTPSWEQKEGGHKDCDPKLITIISSVFLSLLNCLYLRAATFCTCGFRSTDRINCKRKA